jgi:hypothetical protein
VRHTRQTHLMRKHWLHGFCSPLPSWGHRTFGFPSHFLLHSPSRASHQVSMKMGLDQLSSTSILCLYSSSSSFPFYFSQRGQNTGAL